MFNPLALVGQITLSALAEIGRLSRFAGTAIYSIFMPPMYWRHVLQQMWLIGYNSLPVIGLTALFTGAALAQQIFVGGSRFNASSVVPGVVVIAIVRELGPCSVASWSRGVYPLPWRQS
nr:ABC transporter permease [Kordiimonas gwangyangensis]